LRRASKRIKKAAVVPYPSRLAGGWYNNHLKGGLPVLGVRFGGLKAVKFNPAPITCAREWEWEWELWGSGSGSSSSSSSSS
jgi:hypothetical protein